MKYKSIGNEATNDGRMLRCNCWIDFDCSAFLVAVADHRRTSASRFFSLLVFAVLAFVEGLLMDEWRKNSDELGTPLERGVFYLMVIAYCVVFWGAVIVSAPVIWRWFVLLLSR